MNFVQALDTFPETGVFEVTEHEPGDWPNWQLAPLARATVPYTLDGGFYVIKALHILERGRTEDGYLDLFMPERISDSVYFRQDGTFTPCSVHEALGDVIPAVAIEGFGVYDQFYSHRDPEVGLAVLRRGLEVAEQKAAIAEDLGYILRDEGRPEEAIAAFSISIEEGPGSYFILAERADLHEARGDGVSAERDRQQAEEMRKRYLPPWWHPARWWPF